MTAENKGCLKKIELTCTYFNKGSCQKIELKAE